MTTPIGGATNPANGILGQTQPPAVKPTSKSDLDKDAFLKLLVNQLKYQDPMNPAQGTEFLAQTAQFTTVEKLTNLADVQQQMLTAQLTLSAANLVGRTVSYHDALGTVTTGAVTGATLGSSPTLTINGLAIPLSDVTTIGQAGLTPTGPAESGMTPLPGHAAIPSAPASAHPSPPAGPATPTPTPTP